MRTCSRCKQELPDDAFRWRTKGRKHRQSQCRDCAKLTSKEHYTANKQAYKRRSAAHSARKIEEHSRKVYDLLAASSCFDCGERDVLTLDFDHKDRQSKLFSIADAVASHQYGWRKIEAEIAKCDVRCANCHRIKTARENNSYRWKFSLADSGEGS